LNWHPLIDYSEEHLWRGTVLRLLVSQWPYETPVDFMLVEDRDSPSGLSLAVSSGYKAGALKLKLPAEASVEAGAVSVSRAWLVANWAEWVYAECPVERVMVSAGYPPGVGGEDA
jgi:hypothetical protein